MIAGFRLLAAAAATDSAWGLYAPYCVNLTWARDDQVDAW